MAEELEISVASEVLEVAQKLIPGYHERLHGVKLIALFTNRKMMRGDREVSFRVTKLGGVLKFFTSGNKKDVSKGSDFMILFNQDAWKSYTETMRDALVDKAFCYMGLREGETKGGVHHNWLINQTDTEEFFENVRRFGLYHTGLTRLGQEIAQLPLPFAPETESIEQPKEEPETAEV